MNRFLPPGIANTLTFVHDKPRLVKIQLCTQVAETCCPKQITRSDNDIGDNNRIVTGHTKTFSCDNLQSVET